MAILDELNQRQKEAVLQKDGPLLIIAGAGSGKTKTIAHRIANLIASGVPPERILAVTFTNKAAEEMRQRVYALLRQEKMRASFDREPFMGTFHALGAFILRAHGSLIGIPRHFSIFDEDDTRSIFKNLIEELELNPDSYSPMRVRSAISRLKNELMDAASFAREVDDSPYQKNLVRLYAAYEAQLQKMHGVDFDDLLAKTVYLLESKPDTRTFYENRWDYIHIDEYQDTNHAQYALSRILAHRTGNIAVVGDVDQAIYSWRGADWRNIMQFEQDWPGVKVITLEENYRSTKLILEAANAVIANNTERKEKNLRSTKGTGEPINLVVLEDERQEGMFIAEYILHLVTSGASRSSIAVLFRTNAQSRAIEEAFLKKNIPYRLIAGVKFYERKEIKDVLAYIKLAQNPDDLLAKKRIVNTPARGIGKVLMLKYIGASQLNIKEKEKIQKFENIIASAREHIQNKKASAALKAIIKEAGFDAYYKGNKLEEDRAENIKELLSVASKYDNKTPPEGIELFLSEVLLATQETEIETDDIGKVTLLTAHGAKGLEFDVVIVAGMEEGLFPHALSQTRSEIEEERRLFYVALTRAKEKIMITLARRRMLYGEISFNDPSRFLGEIPEQLLSGDEILF